MLNLIHLNIINKAIFGFPIQLDNIVSVEWRLNLLDNTIKDDFYLCFCKDIKNKLYFETVRIKNGIPTEFYLADIKKYRLIYRFDAIKKKIITNDKNESLVKHIENCVDIYGYYLNDIQFLYRMDSINLDKIHNDIYFYSDVNAKNKNTGLVDYRFYNDNYYCEMHRYDYNTLKFNQINILHKHKNQNDKYLYPILEQYNPWQVFYYFNINDLVNPHSIVFDGRLNMPATKELLNTYIGTDKLKSYFNPETDLYLF